MTFIWALLARWGVPESLRKPLLYIGAAIASIALLAVLRGCYDRAVTDRYEAKVAAQVAKKANLGAYAAASASAETKSGVETLNDAIRKAAIGSDDPLKSGLDRLRAGTPKNRAPAH